MGWNQAAVVLYTMVSSLVFDLNESFYNQVELKAQIQAACKVAVEYGKNNGLTPVQLVGAMTVDICLMSRGVFDVRVGDGITIFSSFFKS